MANATLSKDEILEAIGNMSVFDLADLIETFKTKFNVTISAAPAAAAPAAGGAGGAAAAVEEQTEFTVTLKEEARRRSRLSRSSASSRASDSRKRRTWSMVHRQRSRSASPRTSRLQ